MKKVLALVLAVVMVCTVALAEVVLWNGGSANNNKVAVFNPKSNICVTTNTELVFHAAVAPKLKDGKVVTAGNIAYYTLSGTDVTDTSGTLIDKAAKYVMVNAYNKDATAAVKVVNSKNVVGKQNTIDASYFLVPVANTGYYYTGTAFTTWGTTCGSYVNPGDTDTYTYFQFTDNDKATIVAGNKVSAVGASETNVLVNGMVYTKANVKTAVAHSWVASTWDAKGNVLTATCSKCGVVGTVVESIYLAPAGTTGEAYGTQYIYFTPVTTPTTGTTTNPDTGANDVIGVAAALAVVALVSGAAISLKK